MTGLARMRQARLCRLVILCIPLLMVVMPAAHWLGMTLSGTAPGHALVAGADSQAAVDDSLVLNETPARRGSAAVPLEAHHHGEVCCGAGDPPGGSPHEACMAACCPAVLTAGRHPAGVVIAAETDLVLSIPSSASHEDSPPPPRRERMS